MSDAATPATLSQISADVRDQLLDWIVDFDQHWQDGDIERFLGTLPESLQRWRGAALGELVRVDIVKQWQGGAEVRLDAYLEQFPELGSAETVAAELIVAEVEARKLAGKRMSGKELLERFPQQAQAVRQLVSGSSQIASGISRRPAQTIAAHDTASVAPGETFPRPAGGLRGKLAPGSHFGPGDRYRIVRQLGGGGMGAVYLATDSSLGNRKVAIKVPHFSPADGPEMLERFQREAALLATISHPNLGIVYDVNECDGINFLVMEYISGMSLADYIAKHPLTPDKAVWVVRKTAQALQAAHAKGVVHRDLKPDNIMLARDGQPKLIDFGLAVNVEGGGTRATQSGMTMGTPEYMPLEQVTGDLTKIGPRSDVYSLGIVLYKLLTGTVPFTGNSPLAVGVKLFNESAPSPSTHNPDLDPRLAGIVLKAIAKEPEDRFESMEAFGQTLTAYAKSAASPADSFGQVPESDTDSTTSPDSADGGSVSVSPLPITLDPPSALPTVFVQESQVRSIAAAQRARRRRHAGVPIGGFCLAVLFGLVIYVRSGPDTVLRLDVDADDVAITLDGTTVTLNDGPQELVVEPGPCRLHVKAGSYEFDTEQFSVLKGRTVVVSVCVVDSQLVGAIGRNSLFRIPLSNIASKTDAAVDEGIELLRNGDCEEPTEGSVVPGWVVVEGSWQKRGDDPPPFSGKSYFTPGETAVAELTQDIDVSMHKDKIQKREVEFRLSGQLRSYDQGNADSARVIVEYRDAENKLVVAQSDSGATRSTKGWSEFVDTCVAPVDTAWIRVRLISTRSAGSANDGYYDALSLRMVPRIPLVTKRLPSEQWHNLLDMIRLPDHAVFGSWKRIDGMLATDGGRNATLMTPVVVHGNYELRCEFTRWSGNEALGWNLPIGDQSVCLFLGAFTGAVHGLSDVDAVAALKLSTDSGAVSRPGQLDNAIRHRLYAKVRVTKDRAEITATLDDQEIVSWSGSWQSLTPWLDRVLPVADAVGITTTGGCVVNYHTLELRSLNSELLFELGDDWASPLARVAKEPPSEIADKCLTWNGRPYFISDAAMTFVNAQILARKYHGRLLTISSLEEDDFIHSQRNNREIWMAGWRRGDGMQWRDERNRPLRFYRWSPGQPDNWFGGTETLMHTGYGNKFWNDMASLYGHSHACIEWGEEFESNSTNVELAGSTSAGPAASPARPPNEEVIRNGDFRDGLNGWNKDGGADGFITFDLGDRMALSTYGKDGDAITGRLWQSFVVPDDALTLQFMIHGYRGPPIHVGIRQGADLVRRADAPAANNRRLVTWDLKPLRGESVVLEIVDHTRTGYIGADSFEITRESKK